MKKASYNQLKLLRKLNLKKYRDQEGLFLLEGERGVRQALENGQPEVEGIFVTPEFREHHFLKFREVYEVDPGQFAEIADTETPQGIIAVCRKPETPSAAQLSSDRGIVLALDRLQDPGNLGTILRTAAWFGARAVIAGKGSTDVYSPKAVRSTAGAIGVVPVIHEELSVVLSDFETAGWNILLLDSGAGAEPIQTYKRSQKIVLVIGNEANGIDKQLMTETRRRILLPFAGKVAPVESLNAAMAAGIALYALSLG